MGLLNTTITQFYEREPPAVQINQPIQPIDNGNQILEAIQSLKNSLDSRVESQSACKRQRLTEPPSFKRLMLSFPNRSYFL